jgi:hypothetical protein
MAAGDLRWKANVFRESMVAIGQESDESKWDDVVSPWWPVGAASFAWLVALIRLVIASGHHEAANVDVALAAGAVLMIPAIILIVWAAARRARHNTARRHPASTTPRPQLTLIMTSRSHRVVH